MNELDPKDSGQNCQEPLEDAAQAATANAAAEVEVESKPIDAESEAPAESAPTEPQAEAKTDSESDAQAESENATPNYHNLDAQGLLDALRAIVEGNQVKAHREVTTIKHCYFALRNKTLEAELAAFIDAGNPTEAFVGSPDPLEPELKALLASFREKRNAYLEAETLRRKENLAVKTSLLDQLRAIVDDIDTININFPRFQQLQQEFKAINDIPDNAVTDMWKTYQMVVEQFYDRLKMNKELRDLDFRKNLELKQELLNQARALKEEPDVLIAFRNLQDLHAKWREIGPVAKELREQIWTEFSTISSDVRKRHQDYFEQRKIEEQANEEAKEALCKEIDAVEFSNFTSFGAWDKATAKVLDMQARWKQLGHATRKNNTALFSRFRKKCDEFFAAKSAFFKATHAKYAANQAAKIALCEQAEALTTSTDLRKAMDEALKLKSEWKKIGPVSRRVNDTLWERFAKACDTVIDARKREYSELRQEQTGNLQAKRALIAELKAIPADADRAEAVATVRDIQARWQQIGHVPIKQKDGVQEAYREAMQAATERFDLRGNRARMNAFTQRLAGIKGDAPRVNREREKLIYILEQKRDELKTFENNLGFFSVKSKAGNSMVKEMERRIESIKAEIADLQKRIAMVEASAAE